jgi:hypothetical protein
MKEEIPKLIFKEEPQKVTYNILHHYGYQKWELFDGELFGSREEQEQLLSLLIYNLGTKRVLELIQRA